jgi:HK97 family phage major capsid protein
MDEQIKKILEAIAALQTKLESGVASKDYFDAELAKLKADLVSAQAQVKEMNEHMKLRANAMNGLDEDIKKGKASFSMGKLIAGLFLNKWADKNGTFGKSDDSQEYKIVKEYMDIIGKANEHTTTGGAGGYAIPPQAIMQWIEKLYNNLVVKKAGARIMTGLTGSPVSIPRQSGSVTATWLGEGGTLSNSQITDQQITMAPKECGALVTLQNKLILLAASNPSIEQLIMSDMEMQLLLAIDLAALRGAGSSSEPRGIVNTSNILTHALGDNGDYFDFDDALDMEGALEDSNALRGKLAYITHGKIKRRLKKTRIPQYSGDVAGQYVFAPVLGDPQLNGVLGYDMLSTGQLPTNLEKGSSGAVCSEVIFGNWDDLIIGQWGGMDLARSDSAGDAFEKNQSKIRLIQMVDVAVRHPESFVLCNDAKTA